MEDPLDRQIDLGAPPGLQLDEAPPHMLQTSNDEAGVESRRWPIVAMVLVSGLVAMWSVGFVLRSPHPAAVAHKAQVVEETIVDLPADTPASTAPHARVAPNVPSAPVARSAPVAPIAPGRLLIRSSPADAEVFVNGKPRGKTPLVLRELALGSYTIRVARSGYAVEERTLQLTARQPSTSTTIDLRAGKSVAASAAAAIGGSSARLNVQSRPAGARIYVNDRLAGTTPLSIASLPAGPATIRIEMDGYRQWSTKVHVNAGELARVTASLERR
jgi:hypothetical protein